MDRLYCPQCEEPLSHPDKCSDRKTCGWKESPGDDYYKPTIEQLQQSLAQIIHNKFDGAVNAQEEVTAFLAIMKPERDHEKQYRNKTSRWCWPYGDRINYCLGAYLLLDKTFQETIRAASVNEIYWRGEPLGQFMDIISETMRQREIGLEAYRAEGKLRLQGMRFNKNNILRTHKETE